MGTPSDIPLRQLTLDRWSAEEVEKVFRDRPLLLQVKRPRGLTTPRQTRIIVFVHGLNSDAMTWLPFLGEAFRAAELAAFDFGLFNYQTSMFSRLNPFQRLPSVEEWARVLANAIQATILNQERYDSFVLVGHSMGGLISKLAIRSLLVENDIVTLTRLHSLFTYGTPNHGSDRAGALGSLLSPDLALLRAFSNPVHDLQTFWNTRISAIAETPGKLTVHERAIISVKDYWVAPASGISSLQEKFVLRLASSHTALIKPTDANDPRLRWFIEQVQSIQRQSECSLLEIRNGPGLECLTGDEEAARSFAKTLFEALFVLDAGSDDGVAKGDKFGLWYESTEVRDQSGRVVDRIPGSMSLLAAIEVKERAAYCKLEKFAYEPAFEGLREALDQMERQGVQEVDEQRMATLLLSLFGRHATRIPRKECSAIEALNDAYQRVLGEEKKSPAWAKALRELLTASREFLGEFPMSILRDEAAFHEAWSTMELERYEEAAQLFERFSETYPFSTSIGGAREWLDETRIRIRLHESGGQPERQLELAEYLLAQEKETAEAIALAFEAYSRKPGLLAHISLPVRFVLTAEFAFHQLCDMSVEEPAQMGVLLGKYRGDPALRQQTRATVEAKVSPGQAKLLLDLLDSTSADWKDVEPSERLE